MQRARQPPSLWIASGTLLAAIVGCARDGPEVVPVSGKITFEGRPQPEVCRISFVPADPSGAVRPSGGEMQQDGAYQPVPFRGVHGLVPGAYVVRLSYYDLKPGGNRDVEGDWIAHEHVSPQRLIVEPGARRVEHDIAVPAD